MSMMPSFTKVNSLKKKKYENLNLDEIQNESDKRRHRIRESMPDFLHKLNQNQSLQNLLQEKLAIDEPDNNVIDNDNTV